jgi:hypothetical protein
MQVEQELGPRNRPLEARAKRMVWHNANGVEIEVTTILRRCFRMQGAGPVQTELVANNVVGKCPGQLRHADRFGERSDAIVPAI